MRRPVAAEKASAYTHELVREGRLFQYFSDGAVSDFVHSLQMKLQMFNSCSALLAGKLLRQLWFSETNALGISLHL